MARLAADVLTASNCSQRAAPLTPLSGTVFLTSETPHCQLVDMTPAAKHKHERPSFIYSPRLEFRARLTSAGIGRAALINYDDASHPAVGTHKPACSFFVIVKTYLAECVYALSPRER